MKINLPCEIIQDLLPSYADGITGQETAEAVEYHLEDCENCKKIYEDMKKEYDKKMETGEEKELLKKINKKMKRKTKIIILCAAAAVLVIGFLVKYLFTSALKDIPLSDVTVSASVYKIEDLYMDEETGEVELTDGIVSVETDENGEKQIYSVTIGNGTVTVGNGAEDMTEDITVSYVICFPDKDSVVGPIGITKELAEKLDYASLVKITSNWNIEQFLTDAQEVNGEKILYIESLKTTLFHNKGTIESETFMMPHFDRIDKIVYRGESGEETVLWQAE